MAEMAEVAVMIEKGSLIVPFRKITPSGEQELNPAELGELLSAIDELSESSALSEELVSEAYRERCPDEMPALR